MDRTALADARARVDAMCAARGGSCVWIDEPRPDDASFLRVQLHAAHEDGTVVALVAGDTPLICRALVTAESATYAYTSDAIACAKPPPDALAIALIWNGRIMLGTVDELLAELAAAIAHAQVACAAVTDADNDDLYE